MSGSFTDLVLTSTARPGVYTLAADGVTYPIELRPEQDVALGDLLRRAEHVLVGRPDPSGKLAASALLREIGERLWRALMPDTALAEACDAVARRLRQDMPALRLALPDDLATLPWELLCDPDRQGDSAFVARRRPVARLAPGDGDLAPITPPLKVLLLVSAPPDADEDHRVDVESERAAVETATQTAREDGLLHLLVEDIVTVRRVQDALIRFKPHVVHFVGHGGYQDGVGGFLEWEDDTGKTMLMPDARLADLLRGRGIRAVLLHGCETAVADRRSDLSGVAGALVGAGIPAVLAMQAKLTYESSQRASEMFYRALTLGADLALATFEARIALSQANRPDWAVPILRATDAGLAPLLDTAAPRAAPDPSLPRRDFAADIPAPAQVFVGRHKELRELRLMLESAPGRGKVMAVITGPGGIGKSTLASQAVVRYGGRYKAALTLSGRGYQGFDLWLRDIGEFLARHGAPGFLAATLPDPNISVDGKIQAAVDVLNAAGPFLLVVDNVETLQGENRTLRDSDLARFLGRLLTNLRGGRVLVTGRYAVEGLLPDDKFQGSVLPLALDDLSRYETERLMDRLPGLSGLGEAVRDEIVGQFGGLPYVYDLLSSRAAGVNLTALVKDIQDRVTVEKESRAGEEWERVRSRVVEFSALDVVVQQRLSNDERRLLGQLSVFQRPFPLEAMENGLGAKEEQWRALLDWSLLRHDPTEMTYRLHSLTARYAAALLDATQCADMQIQAAEWYLSYLATSHDLADALEAHRLFFAAGDAERAGALANELGETLSRFGLYDLWRELAEQTRTTAGEKTIAAALHQLGVIAQDQGEVAEARRLYGESLAISERLGDQRGRAITLHQLGMIAQHQGEYAEARRLYGESLAIKERLGDQGSRAPTLGQLGVIAQAQGEYAEARRLYGEVLEVFERLGDQRGRATTLHNLGMIAQDQGEYAEARRLYGESLAISERLGDQGGRANTLHQMGTLAGDQGEYGEARRLYGESLAIKERLGDQGGRARTLHGLGMIAQDQGEVAEARRLYGESLSIKERIGDQFGIAFSLGQLGVLAIAQRDYRMALQYTVQALVICERLGLPNRTVALRQLAQIRDEVGEAEFNRLWREVVGGQPPEFAPEAPADREQDLARRLVAFINAPTWNKSQRMVESQPDLLSAEADALLARLAQAQTDEGARQLIEAHRALLARCREVGVAEAFEEVIRAQEARRESRETGEGEAAGGEGETEAGDGLQRLLQDVYLLMTQGTVMQRRTFANQLAQAQTRAQSEASPWADFFGVLVALLRGEAVDASPLVEPFASAWAALQAALNQVGRGGTGE